MKLLLSAFVQWSRRFRARLSGATFARPRHLGAGVDLSLHTPVTKSAGEISAGPGSWIEQGAVLHAFGGSIRLGEDVFIGPYAVIYGHGGVAIGDASLIAMHCRILSSNHTVPPMGTLIRAQPDITKATRIGRDVWLGAGVTVLAGVTIGDGCVVGAGAVVTKDLPAGAIAQGVPATVRAWRPGSGPTFAAP